MSGLDLLILASSKTLEIAIVLFLWKGGARDTWIWLERLCIFRFSCTLIDWILRSRGLSAVYFYEFWSAEVVALVIQFALLAVIYRVPLQAAKWLPSRFKAGVFIACMLCGFALKASYPRVTFSTLPDFAIDANHLLSLLSCSILLLAALYTRMLGFRLSNRALLIDAGLSLGFVSSLLWYTLHHFNPQLQAAIGDRIGNCAYLGTRLVWLYAFIRPDISEVLDSTSKTKIRAEFDRFTSRTRPYTGVPPEKEVETIS